VTIAVSALVVALFAAAVVSGFRSYRRPLSWESDQGIIAALAFVPEYPMDAPREARTLRWLAGGLVLTLGGYLFFDRAFAYIHVPGTPIFIGEAVIILGGYAMLAANLHLGRLVRHSATLKALVAYMAWGAFLLARAIGQYGEDAIRDAALWYYASVAILVVGVIVSRPDRLSRWLGSFGKATPYVLIWFPFAIIADALFADIAPLVPDSEVPFTSHKVGNMAVMAAAGLGFMWLVDRDGELYSERQRAGLTALATIVLLFAAMKNRGGFVSAAVALAVALIFMRRRRSEISLIMVGVVVVLLAVGLLSRVEVDLFSDGRSVSVEQFLQNMSSVVDQNSGGSRQTTTTKWRLEIWGKVLHDVTTKYPLTGYGPGPDLGKIYKIAGEGDVPLRNPHNSHVGILARSGFVGVVLWAVIWITWTIELLLTRSRMLARGRTMEAGVIVWLIVTVVAILVNAIFDPTLEGPQVGWWLWASLGFGIAMSLLERAGRLPEVVLQSGTRTLQRGDVRAPVGVHLG
jgi:hypothetical protein